MLVAIVVFLIGVLLVLAMGGNEPSELEGRARALFAVCAESHQTPVTGVAFTIDGDEQRVVSWRYVVGESSPTAIVVQRCRTSVSRQLGLSSDWPAPSVEGR